MSPTLDFKNIGEVLDYQFLRSTIKSINSAADTCVLSSGETALIFYH